MFFTLKSLNDLVKLLPTLWSVTKLPGPRYSKNVEPQWGFFALTRIQMSAGLSLSISDFKSYLFKLWEHHKKGRERTNPFISVQGGKNSVQCARGLLWERASGWGLLWQVWEHSQGHAHTNGCPLVECMLGDGDAWEKWGEFKIEGIPFQNFHFYLDFPLFQQVSLSLQKLIHQRIQTIVNSLSPNGLAALYIAETN